MTFEEFKQLAKNRFGDSCSYEKTQENFTKWDKVKIVCSKHAYETVAWRYLKAKHPCKYCERDNRRNAVTPRVNTKIFIARARELYGDLYDYSLVNYKVNHQKIDIICSKHGIFSQTPANHLSGYRCLKCTSEEQGLKVRKSTEEYIQKAKEVHGDTYSYELVEYTGAHKKIWITCKEHGPFYTKANNHTQCESGCPLCCESSYMSKDSQEWLDSLDVTIREYWIPTTRYRVDGFDPYTNRVFEYLGAYFHGNPKYFHPDKMNTKLGKTFGELYRYTLKRLAEIESLGYTLVLKWEEPKGIKPLIERS